MPSESFRFIHASDFHLERPLGDLDLLPAHLRDALAAAPWDAAKAVFEAALAENIDFVVLAGDLLSPLAAGPHGMSMLLDYFEQLNAKGTPVFWAAGHVDDPQKWPESAPLPPCVTLFPKDEVLSVPVQRAGRTICIVHGLSSGGRKLLHVPSYRTEPSDEYSVAVGYGRAEADALAEGRFHYWALGGQHNRREIDGAAEAGAVYCGSPQGRSLEESGPHGYTVVDVDAEETTRMHNIECDTIRYCNVQIDAAEIAAVGSIQNLIGERIGRLHHESGGRHLIIGWDISLSSSETLQTFGDAQDLLQWARREYGHGAPSAWTASLTIRPPREYPSGWQDEETILGDFLRVSTEHHKSDAREMNLLPLTEEHAGLLETTASLLAEVSAVERMDVLDQATLLGVELLRGGKPKLVQKS
jgi:DNA repair exonuclease SbcCD nuclease subunit